MTTTHLVPLPTRHSRERIIAQAVVDCSSELDIRYIKVWHLIVSSQLAATEGVERNFLRALHTCVPRQYYQYTKDMTREQNDAFDAEIARWVYQLAPQTGDQQAQS